MLQESRVPWDGVYLRFLCRVQRFQAFLFLVVTHASSLQEAQSDYDGGC